MAKNSATKVSKKVAKKGSKKVKRSWTTYVKRALKEVDPKLTIASRTTKIVNSFVTDIFERIATQAATVGRVNKKSTLGSREVQTAVRLVLPAELARHAMSEGTKAIAKLTSA